MSVQAISWAFAQDVRPASLKLVLIALANRSDEEGFCYPSIRWISQQASCDESTARRAIAALIEGGYLSKTERYRADGTQDRNLYKILIGGRVANCEGTPADCGGEGGTDATPNTKINKKIKNTRTREEFLREIDQGIADGQFRDLEARYKLTDDLVRTSASDAWDYWEGYNKHPADPMFAFRGWLRSWNAESKINQHRINSVAPKKENKELSEWRARVDAWRKTKFWPRQVFGPAPDEAGTLCPRAILDELKQNEKETA